LQFGRVDKKTSSEPIDQIEVQVQLVQIAQMTNELQVERVQLVVLQIKSLECLIEAIERL